MVKRRNGLRIHRHAGQLQNVADLCFLYTNFLLRLSPNRMASIAQHILQQFEAKPL